MKIRRHRFHWKDPQSQKLSMSDTQNFAMKERYVTQVESLISNFDLRKEDLILDFGCGIGEHVIELRRRGYNVNGYDPSQYYIIKKAKKLAARKGINLEFNKKTGTFASL